MQVILGRYELAVPIASSGRGTLWEGCPVTGISARYGVLTWAGLLKWQRVGVAGVIEVGPPQRSTHDLPVDAARRLPR
jgi:hypothetical protein